MRPFELALWEGAVRAVVGRHPVEFDDDPTELAYRKLFRRPAHARA